MRWKRYGTHRRHGRRRARRPDASARAAIRAPYGVCHSGRPAASLAMPDANATPAAIGDATDALHGGIGRRVDTVLMQRALGDGDRAQP